MFPEGSEITKSMVVVPTLNVKSPICPVPVSVCTPDIVQLNESTVQLSEGTTASSAAVNRVLH